ncbi:hypothetical protein GCM10009090_13110 [[Pseudomonas] boreopolis]|uniref:Uncharacterized protein n=1 Tax=Xanthomonas boreopolis TaxID=86183 RepID=A0A919KHV4_9XANT|nr:hypothetical protein GCM10009090_13110 [[Pseudomonas] boreopolis]
MASPCNNTEFKLPDGWKLQRLNSYQWQIVAPQVSSLRAWVSCNDGTEDYQNFLGHAEQQNAEHLHWPYGDDPGRRTVMSKLSDGSLGSTGDSVLIFCKNAYASGESLSVCTWADPYPRRELRADGYVGFRWSDGDPLAVSQRRALEDSINRTFLVHPFPALEQ